MAPAVSAPADLVGGFTREVFERHLASQASHPAWWLERKRSAYARFEALPMPTRTDEAWRFSSIAGINLAGFAPGTKGPAASSPAPAAGLPLTSSTRLSFLNGHRTDEAPIAPALAARGVVVSTLSAALATNPELLREHFMAQPSTAGIVQVCRPS